MNIEETLPAAIEASVEIPNIEEAEVIVPAQPFDETLSFFTERLGFRVAAIFPANNPACAVVVGHGTRLRLLRDCATPPGTIRLACRDLETPITIEAPNATRIELVSSRPPIELPALQPELAIARYSEGQWVTGRAGMRYRDLIPARQGGRFGAAHIQIEKGGPVPDYVHYHRVRFQIIYCYRGWVRLAYEDQGPEFVMQAGDCVLQPPEIRHRVLESSAGLEVVELSSPAEHETLGDLQLELPNGTPVPGRRFDGQGFLHHVAEKAAWDPAAYAGFEARTIGLGQATEGLLEARVLRCSSDVSTSVSKHANELLFRVVLEGKLQLRLDDQEELQLDRGDAFTVPGGQAHSMTASAGTTLLEVEVPST